VFKSF
jgi:hypothetical protein